MKLLRSIFAAKNKKKSARRKRQFAVESLEARQLMAGDIALSGGVIQIGGSLTHDKVIVSVDSRGTRDRSDDRLVVSLTNYGQTQTKQYDLWRRIGMLLYSNVTKIEFDGSYGDDTFRNQTHVPSRADGGHGSDYLIGGSGRDELFGGSYND